MINKSDPSKSLHRFQKMLTSMMLVCVWSNTAPQADNALQLGRAHALLGNWDAALAALEEEVRVIESSSSESIR